MKKLVPTVAQIHKVMKNGKMAKIGTLKKANGQFTTDEIGTLQELFDCLLPPSVTPGNQSDLVFRNNLSLNDGKLIEIINHETVCAAVNEFDPYKSPGFDGIYPIMLQKGIRFLSPYLIKIFKLSLKTGKLANCWLQVKTVFIPKPGKANYTNAKSYQPISLMSFVLKTLERLVYWHLQNDHWHKIPINRRVYSYREGVSTETALHEATQIIERALNNKQMVLAVYLDISGAFSNTAVHSMTSGLAKRGVEVEIVKWVDHLLTGRIARAKLGNTEAIRDINNGCAEGGVLSPISLIQWCRRPLTS